MNQNEQNDEYNIVIDTLQKKLDALEEIQRGSDNSRRVVGGGVGMMDSIRYEQIDELTKAIQREKAFATETDHIPDATKMEWPDDAVRELLSKHAEPPFPDEAVAEFKDFLAEVDALRAALKATQQLTLGAKIRKAKDVDGNSNVVLAADLADEHRTLAKWLNEEIDAPVDKQALAKVLAATQCLAVKECVTAQPALVRLTFDEAIAIFRRPGIQEWGVALAIMDAMERKNGGAA